MLMHKLSYKFSTLTQDFPVNFSPVVMVCVITLHIKDQLWRNDFHGAQATGFALVARRLRAGLGLAGAASIAATGASTAASMAEAALQQTTLRDRQPATARLAGEHAARRQWSMHKPMQQQGLLGCS